MMPIVIYGKLGTWGAGYFRLKSIRKTPTVNQIVLYKRCWSDGRFEEKWEQWNYARIYRIDTHMGELFYRLEKF